MLIEEPSLLPGFKYVSEQLNDDHCLALLYKLKRAFGAVQKHGIAEAKSKLELLDQYIEDAWDARGLYPGLGSVVSVLADLAEGEPQMESSRGQRLVDALDARQHVQGSDLLDSTFALLRKSSHQ